MGTIAQTVVSGKGVFEMGFEIGCFLMFLIIVFLFLGLGNNKTNHEQGEKSLMCGDSIGDLEPGEGVFVKISTTGSMEVSSKRRML